MVKMKVNSPPPNFLIPKYLYRMFAVSRRHGRTGNGERQSTPP